MDKTLEIRPLATIEIIEAYDWYKKQQSGLGVAFLTSLERFFEQLRKNPLSHSYLLRKARKARQAGQISLSRCVRNY